MKIKSLNIVIVILIGCLPFLIGINGPFLLDDFANLPYAKAAAESLDVYWQSVFANESGPLRRPISNSTFTLNYALFGQSPTSFKAINIALHFLNGIAIFAVTKKILRLISPDIGASSAHNIALLSSFIWVAHPIQVSTVLYIVQRMTILSTLFMLCAIYLLLDMLESQKSRAGILKPLLIIIALALSILSKEITLIFPVLILSVLICTDKTRMAEILSDSYKRNIVISIIALITFGFAYVVITLPELMASYSGRDFNFYQRIATEPVILADYLKSILTFDIQNMGLYLDDTMPLDTKYHTSWIPLTILISLLSALVLGSKKYPIICFSLLWYLAGQSLESSIFPLELAFEHRNYLPLLGPSILIATAIISIRRYVSHSFFIVIITAFSLTIVGLNAARSHQWSRIDLFIRGELKNHPQSVRALAHSISFDIEIGNTSNAIDAIKKSQLIYPNSFFFYSYNLHLACTEPVEINWDKALKLLNSSKSDKEASLTLRLLVEKVSSNRCGKINNNDLARFLTSAGHHFELIGNGGTSEQMYILSARVYELTGDINQSIALLRRAININKDGDLAALELAYLQLNNGMISDANTTLGILKKRGISMEVDLNDLDNKIMAERNIQSNIQ